MNCNSPEHYNRRTILKAAGLSGLSWLSPVATTLARAQETDKQNGGKRPKSLIVLWMEGAPSQLETFDPHPGSKIAAGSKAIKTNAAGIMLGEGLEQTATQMDSISLIRALTSKEGDHERAIYNVKTGYRMDPTLVHPSIGSIICHQLTDAAGNTIDIPRHVSILPGQQPARGGYLGDSYDAFKVFDPLNSIPDVKALVAKDRQKQRLVDLQSMDERFLASRSNNQILKGKLGNHNLDAALKMMASDQLAAFDVSKVPMSVRDPFGDTPFGRSCLAAIQLIESGVRCVEVTLGGWDTHVNNHELQGNRIKILDPAFASLIRELKQRDLLDTTMVVCGGEFGRTPWLNGLGGRDHWPHGFSIAMAGGGVQGGRVIGETSPTPEKGSKTPTKFLKDANPIENVHATILNRLGIEYSKELQTPIGRPLKICEGEPIEKLFDS